MSNLVITLEIKAPGLENAILALAGALKPQTEPIQVASTVSPTVVQQPIQTVQTTAVPSEPQTPIATAPVYQQPSVVPTAAPSPYTQEQLAVAATQLMDAGKIQELRNLLATFGVSALTALTKERYGEFALKLREMGAKI